MRRIRNKHQPPTLQTLNDTRARLDDIDRLQQSVQNKGAIPLMPSVLMVVPQPLLVFRSSAVPVADAARTFFRPRN